MFLIFFFHRTAVRIHDLCRANGGVYIKFGQQIAGVPVLPPSYIELFKTFYDKAPIHGPEVVKKIIQEDFGKPVEELFEKYVREPSSPILLQASRDRRYVFWNQSLTPLHASHR